MKSVQTFCMKVLGALVLLYFPLFYMNRFNENVGYYLYSFAQITQL